MAFAFCKVCICLFFMLGQSKDWKYLGYIAIPFALVSLILTSVLVPESPRYLYGKQRLEECKRTLEHIQRVNKADPSYTIELSSKASESNQSKGSLKEL